MNKKIQKLSIALMNNPPSKPLRKTPIKKFTKTIPSSTAQLLNVLNDMNNIVSQITRLESEEKYIRSKYTFEYLKKYIKESKQSYSGHDVYNLHELGVKLTAKEDKLITDFIKKIIDNKSKNSKFKKLIKYEVVIDNMYIEGIMPPDYSTIIRDWRDYFVRDTHGCLKNKNKLKELKSKYKILDKKYITLIKNEQAKHNSTNV